MQKDLPKIAFKKLGLRTFSSCLELSSAKHFPTYSRRRTATKAVLLLQNIESCYLGLRKAKLRITISDGPEHWSNHKHWIKRMSSEGIFKSGPAEWSARTVLAPKPDGLSRIYAEVFKLNGVTKSGVHLISRMDNFIASVSKIAALLSVDVSSGYWQVVINSKDWRKTVPQNTDFIAFPGSNFKRGLLRVGSSRTMNVAS